MAWLEPLYDAYSAESQRLVIIVEQEAFVAPMVAVVVAVDPLWTEIQPSINHGIHLPVGIVSIHDGTIT